MKGKNSEFFGGSSCPQDDGRGMAGDARQTSSLLVLGSGGQDAHLPHRQDAYATKNFVVILGHDPRSRVAGRASGYSDGNNRRRSIGEAQIRRTRSVRYRAADLKAKSLG